MSGWDNLLARMAARIGIAPRYRDAFGASVETSPDTLRALLDGLGLPVDSQAEARDSLARLERLKAGPVPPLVPVAAGQPFALPSIALPGRADWRLAEENGTLHEGVVPEGAAALPLPALPAGYHRLAIGDREATVIAAPDRCWVPEVLEENGRLWGAAAQVYALRSARDFGIGDYTDVARAAQVVGRLGGSFLGISPLHALFSADRTKISPYSPSSRLFLEPLYLDPEAVEGFAGSGADSLLRQPALQEGLARLRGADLIDYAAVWDLKRALLDALWARFREGGQTAAFEDFRRRGGEPLEAHATFEALSEHCRAQGQAWAGAWPAGFRDSRSAEVARFRAERAERVAFHAWLQWLADGQLARAAESARAALMPIGLYRDLAVGADRGGSEIWAAPERFATALSIGAPPDPLGPQGQDWGLPPFNPLTLEADGLVAFRALVAANMRHAGAIRIDHAFQLKRLFLIPSGAEAVAGAYVDYPFAAMLAVLRVESHRARCFVIAEDLGTAPDGFSDAIMASGVLSYRVLPFEREGAAFKAPRHYPRSALAVMTTHDLPTLRGWWRGLDIDLRQTFGVFGREQADAERAARAADRRHFSEALAAEGLLPSADPPEEAPLEGAARFLARTAAGLTALQFEDATGELNQPNMPGLDRGHPNWLRRLSTPIEEAAAPGSLLNRLAVAMAEEGRDAHARPGALAAPPPRATYRLQFHKDFTFDDAARIVPYLARLGVSHLYASPIQASRPGSLHGYDIVDHTSINPELGGEAGFHRLAEVMEAHGLHLLLDLVPNHMGVGGRDNAWWLSVLEWGRLSPVADAFDIDWDRPGADGKLVVPFLGRQYGEALAKGELTLAFDPEEGNFSVWHWDHRFPVAPPTYPLVLDYALGALDALSEEAFALTEELRALAGGTAPEARIALPARGEALKRRLAEMARRQPAFTDAIGKAVGAFNEASGLPLRFHPLHRLLEAQAYRLAYWRVTASDINYRRFFDVNDLAGLRVEVPKVFAWTHDLVFRLIDEGLVHGLRIDHIDGLADPEDYVRRLQRRVGPGFYIVVEKILEPGENLRRWPVSGTTGYDALNLIDGILVDGRAGGTFERLYRQASGLPGRYGALLRQAKTAMTETSFTSEREVLVAGLKRIADADLRTRDYTDFALRQALVEIIARMPVYRTYLDERAPSPEDVDLIRASVAAAKEGSALADDTVHDFIADALLGRVEGAGEGCPDCELLRLRCRFQQLTGPVMAKSLEDTLFYRYGRLIALNEVGGDPSRFGVSEEDFHEANAARAKTWPHAMIATATHDTKRGEDARARLLALSEMPEAWAEALAAWREVVACHLSIVDNLPAPDANDQVILFQALLGAWPMELQDGGTGADWAGFRERMEDFATKALREAKRRTSWIRPDEAYEGATHDLLKALLAPDSAFVARFRPLVRRLSFLGMLNGLSRTVLKATVPGVPDLYQGTEFWDFSLVDPDNRRPVDYAARIEALDDDSPAGSLLESWPDGRIKQQFLRRLLQDRAAAPDLYAHGGYRPLAAQGPRAHHLLAFARGHRGADLVVLVPRFWASLTEGEHLLPAAESWHGTSIALPPGDWREVLTGRSVAIPTGCVSAGDLLADLPFAVLRRVDENAGDA